MLGNTQSNKQSHEQEHQQNTSVNDQQKPVMQQEPPMDFDDAHPFECSF